MRANAALFLVPLLAPAALLATPAAAAVPLAAHHAEYTLTLDTATPRSDSADVVAAHGTMTYDVTDACTAWASNQRLSLTLTNHDGQDVEMVSDYATYETKDGTHLDFHMKQTTDTAVTQQVEGSATLPPRPADGAAPGAASQAGSTPAAAPAGGATPAAAAPPAATPDGAAPALGVVHYTVPAVKAVPLPEGTLFPMAHTEAIIQGAEAGKRFLTLPLFDGTGPDGAQDTFVTILDWGKPDTTKWPALAELPSGRVHISFFDRNKPGAGQTPDYEIGMRYWENGVADGLRMNFGDFVMDGTLSTFRPGAAPHC